MVTGTVPSGETKWESARRAVGTITGRFEASIDFGLLVFPNPSRCDVSSVAVGVGPLNASAIAAFLATPPPGGGNWTPMARAIDVATAYPPMSDASRRRVAVLVTDGWQWCDPYDPATRFLPVERAAALRATGTTLYVVGFGDGVDALTLNRMAYESGTYVPGCDPTGDTPTTPDPCYYRAEDTSGLESVLDTIARRATLEVCDGLDNDCDDATDEDLSRSCSTICGEGTETCGAGSWVGCTARAPATGETCDGIVDDDCDGVVDEGCECTNGATGPCGVDTGECAAGARTCVAGSWGACSGHVGPADEDCNALDDDCDGMTDEGCDCVDGTTRSCGEDVGECRSGTQACTGGSWGDCGGGWVGPAGEDCNAVDDDCDGMTDEGCACVDGETRSCGVDAGACRSGTQACGGGAWGDCLGYVGPVDEDCDAVDDDCDGVTDEGCLCAEGDTRSCGLDAGACSTGTQTCIGGAWGGCTGSAPPAPEICNGEDDDCDGIADEGCPCVDGETRPCGGDTGECSVGTQTCVGTRWSTCAGAAWPTAETCNGRDDDCNGVIDNGATCEPGLSCRSGACVDDNPDPEPPAGAGTGCGCAVAGGGGALAAALLGLLAFGVLTRRRRA